MVAVVGSIAAELLLDRSKFDQGLGRAGITAKKFEGDTRQTLGRVDRSFSSTFGNIAKGAGSAAMALGKAGLAGAIAGLVGGSLLNTVRSTATELARIGDQARQAGMSVQAFQELGAVARANRLETEDLSAAMRELQLRADEFIISAGKSGSAAEAFQRIGFSVDELKAKLADPSALLSEIVGKVQRLDRAAQIRVFDELFGGDGERLIRILDDGEDGIRQIIQAAKDGGQIFDTELVERAAELDRKFSEVSATVETGLKSAIVSAAAALSDFIVAFNHFITAPDRMIAGQGQPFWDQMTPEARNKLRLDVQLSGIRKPEDVYADFGLNPDGTFKIQPPEVPVTPASGGNRGRSGAINETEKQAQATQALVAQLRDELALVGANATEQRVMGELRRLNIDAASEQGQTIRGLVEAIESEKLAYQTLQDAVATASDLTKDFVGGLVTDLRNGVSGAEALSNAFGRLGDRLLDMALDQAINGLFANLLGAGAGSFGANSQVLEIAA